MVVDYVRVSNFNIIQNRSVSIIWRVVFETWARRCALQW
jgi:hypothetical protein